MRITLEQLRRVIREEVAKQRTLPGSKGRELDDDWADEMRGGGPADYVSDNDDDEFRDERRGGGPADYY